MTADRHADDAPGHEGAVAHHLPDDHGEDHGHDDHAHGGDEAEALGSIDTAAWLAGGAGIAIGVAIAAAFALATGAIS